MRVVPFNMPNINHYRFIYLYLILNVIRVQSSEPLHAKMNPTSCLFGSQFACAQTAIFSAKLCSKNAGETSIVLWITLVSKKIPTPAVQTKIHSVLWRIFSANKSAPANRKTGFYANCDPNKQKVGLIFE
jgi:hypothetical protein